MNKARATLYYGNSGSGKTVALYHFAKWLKSKYTEEQIRDEKLQVRLIHADPGGYHPFVDDPEMIDSGWVDVLNVASTKSALSDFRKLSEGYWYGKTKKGQKVIAKDEENRNLKGVIAYLVEGISSICELYKDQISTSDTKIGFASVQYEEEGYVFGSPDRGHYNIMQQEFRRILVHGFEKLPVEYVQFTALVESGFSKEKQMKVFGPKAAGTAATADIPSWFQDTLHLTKQKVKLKEGKEVDWRVAWFEEHPDAETGMVYLAKPRVLPQLEEKLKEWSKGRGWFRLGAERGVDLYFEKLEEMRKEMRRDGEKTI